MFSKKFVMFFAAGLALMSCQQSRHQQAAHPANHSAADSTALTSTGKCNAIVSETPYDIPSQRFDETAQALAHESGCFIETDLSKTGSVIVKPVKGKISIKEAIEMAIKGTDLKIVEENPDVLKIDISR